MYSQQETIEKIKEFAGLLLTPDQISILLDIDAQQFKTTLRDTTNPITKAYNLGKTEIILEIRKQEIQLARLGSPMAVELFNNFILEQKIGEK